MISVSVIIPTYNRENIVLNSIESALSQKGAGSEFELSEIIVVDDCSTDGGLTDPLRAGESTRINQYGNLSKGTPFERLPARALKKYSFGVQ